MIDEVELAEMDEETACVALNLLEKILSADFAGFHGERPMSFAVDTGWFEVTPEEANVIAIMQDVARRSPRSGSKAPDEPGEG